MSPLRPSKLAVADGRSAPDRHRAGSDERLVAALAAGQTYAEAAEAAGVSERTVRRRAAEPEILEAIARLRGDLLRTLSAEVSRSASKAAERLDDLLDSESERIQLDAIRLVSDLVLRLHTAADLDARLAQVERLLGDNPGRAA